MQNSTLTPTTTRLAKTSSKHKTIKHHENEAININSTKTKQIKCQQVKDKIKLATK